MKYKKISWLKFYRDCLLLSQEIKKDKIQFDKIIAIARGGLIVARILSDALSLPISNIVISSYQDLKQLKEPKIIEESTANFNGQTLLIIDEVSDTGKTFHQALSYFKNKKVKKIYTASTYIKPKTQFIPNFWVKKIDAWIIFPYDLFETHKAFLKQTDSEKKAKTMLKKVGFKKWEIDFLPRSATATTATTADKSPA